MFFPTSHRRRNLPRDTRDLLNDTFTSLYKFHLFEDMDIAGMLLLLIQEIEILSREREREDISFSSVDRSCRASSHLARKKLHPVYKSFIEHPVFYPGLVVLRITIHF